MRTVKLYAATLASFLMVAVPALADGDKEKAEGHCEKKDKSGEIKDIEAKDKADCKKQGGKWNKGHSDEHKHQDGEGEKK